METKLVLCLAALIALTSASYCPTYSCDTGMTSNTCAGYVSGSAFKLNSNGCQSNYYCSAIAVGLWAELINASSTSSGVTTSCTAVNSSSPSSSTFTSMSCGTKLSNKTFKSGQTVISCTADSDCKLADGTYTNCMCIFKTDGTGICEASASNEQVYGGYWTDCGTSNTITQEEVAAYWTFYMLYWEYIQSTVSCMNIFKETTQLNTLKEKYQHPQAYCPKYTCETTLGSNVCASRVSGSTFQLNSNGCQSNYECSALAVDLWAELLNSSSSTASASYTCTAVNAPSPSSSTFTSMSCGNKLANKNFKSGQTIVSCIRDSDCKLADDTNTNCMCVFKSDGTGICEASTSNDQVYGGFWNDCGTSYTITDENTAAYWAYYMLYWEYIQSTVTCMSIFRETTQLNTLEYKYQHPQPYCPKYSCDASLGSNVCASYVAGSAFKLNSNGCLSNYACSAIAVGLWAELINTSSASSSSSYSCVAVTTSGTSNAPFTSMSCGTKLPNKNFKSGQTVISCASDSDCVLVDGTYSNCMCVFKSDGTGICEASTSNDQVYGGYWTACGTSNTITDEDSAAYWVFYMLYWEYTQSTVGCMDIFLETEALKDLEETYHNPHSYCPTYTCEALASNVCVTRTSGSSFKINTNGCDSDHMCSAVAVSEWAELQLSSSTSSDSTYSCIPVSSTKSNPNDLFISLGCGTKLPNKNFKNGQTAVSCTTNLDCQLTDSTYTDCICIFKSDGTGICEASTSNDQVYGGYWTDCGVDNMMEDGDMAAFWTYYMMFWEYTQSSVNCMDVFLEVKTLNDLYEKYNAATCAVFSLFVFS